jgi:hypothetical protein
MRLKGGQQLLTNPAPTTSFSWKISQISKLILLGISGAALAANVICYNLSLLNSMELLGNLLFNVGFIYLIYIGLSNRPYSKLIFGIGLLVVMIFTGVIAYVSYIEGLSLYVTWWINLGLWILGAGCYVFSQLQLI